MLTQEIYQLIARYLEWKVPLEIYLEGNNIFLQELYHLACYMEGNIFLQLNDIYQLTGYLR